MSDPLTVAIRELDAEDVDVFLAVYRRLAFDAASGGRRAFFMGLAAHLLAERRRRTSVLTAMVADMLDDGEAGEIVTE